MNTINAKITAVKAVQGNKVQIEVSQNKGGVNVTSLLNASDDRFSTSVRKAWTSGEPSDIKTRIPAISTLVDQVINAGVGNAIQCDILASMLDDDGNAIELGVQIKEATSPLDTWQEENITKAVKINPATQMVLLLNGAPIFSKTSIVPNNAIVDERLSHDSEIPHNEFVAQLASVTAQVTATTEQVA